MSDKKDNREVYNIHFKTREKEHIESYFTNSIREAIDQFKEDMDYGNLLVTKIVKETVMAPSFWENSFWMK